MIDALFTAVYIALGNNRYSQNNQVGICVEQESVLERQRCLTRWSKIGSIVRASRAAGICKARSLCMYVGPDFSPKLAQDLR
jgi:hypothetical protein